MSIEKIFTNTSINADCLTPRPSGHKGPIIHKKVACQKQAHEFSTSRGHAVFPVDLASKNISMSVGQLNPLECSNNHRHAYEALTYILSGNGYSLIEGEKIAWSQGDCFYVAPWHWHQHFNTSSQNEVSYLTATNLPLLHKLGQTVIREEKHSEQI